VHDVVDFVENSTFPLGRVLEHGEILKTHATTAVVNEVHDEMLHSSIVAREITLWNWKYLHAWAAVSN
jgi:hypothetical protein